MEKLNFSWLIDREIAGHSAPMSDDDLNYLKSKGIKALVRMAETHKARVTPAQVEKLGFMDCYEPVPDFTAPRKAQVDRMVTFINPNYARSFVFVSFFAVIQIHHALSGIKQSVAEGKPVAVSCGAGIGRTGTVLACYLVSKSYAAERAMDEVRHKRGAEIETDDQREAVRSYAKHLGKQ